ncbi:hypothetical protein [Streptomyces sp. NPDC056452]
MMGRQLLLAACLRMALRNRPDGEPGSGQVDLADVHTEHVVLPR